MIIFLLSKKEIQMVGELLDSNKIQCINDEYGIKTII